MSTKVDGYLSKDGKLFATKQEVETHESVLDFCSNIVKCAKTSLEKAKALTFANPPEFAVKVYWDSFKDTLSPVYPDFKSFYYEVTDEK